MYSKNYLLVVWGNHFDYYLPIEWIELEKMELVKFVDFADVNVFE